MELKPTDALLLIDLQLDFMQGGALAIAGGDEVVPIINRLAQRFDHVVLTQDWHPNGHISFASSHAGRQPYTQIAVAYGQQTLWPEHCLQGTAGAGLHPELRVPHAELILRKGFRREIDSYSAFMENDYATPTGLAGYLKERGVTRLFLAGLAYDFCVRFSAVDGKAFGFEMVVIEDACRAVNLPGSVGETNAALAAADVARISSGAFVMQEGWIATTATVTSCQFQSPGLSTLAFGFQRGEKFRISFDYYAHGRLYSDEFQSAKALPQNTQFPITYNPFAPSENDRTHISVSRGGSTKPAIFVVGIVGSILLSLIWLAVLRGCP